MARLYSNENFPLPVVEELRRLGHDVLTSLDADNAGRAVPDDEVLAFAEAEHRALLTLDRKHFIKLHNEGAAHFGIVACTFDADFVGQAARIDAALRATPSIDRAVIRVNCFNP